jgi:hypothetical protein
MLSYRSKHNFISTAELNNLAVNTGVGQTEKNPTLQRFEPLQRYRPC